MYKVTLQQGEHEYCVQIFLCVCFVNQDTSEFCDQNFSHGKDSFWEYMKGYKEPSILESLIIATDILNEEYHCACTSVLLC